MKKQLLNKEDAGDCLRCANCKKVLAKRFSDGHFEIKCPRCDTINTIREDMKVIFIKKESEH